MGTSFLSPSGQTFLSEGISNAKESRDLTDWIGINDFSIFNPYYHYYSAPVGSGAVTDEPSPVYIDYRVDYTKPLSGSGLP